MEYTAIEGQSLLDVCLNTYGSLDYFTKLLVDSNVENPDQVPYTGQKFTYDETLIIDASINKTTTLNNIRYATAYGDNGNSYFITIGGSGNIITTPPNNTPPPTATSMYQKTTAYEYISNSVGGETTITIPSLANKDILQIEKNIQPLGTSEYGWSKTTYTLTLTEPIYKDEKLFILVTQMIIT